MKNRTFALIISLTSIIGIGTVTIENYTGTDVVLADGTTIETQELPTHLTKQYKTRKFNSKDSLTIYIHHTAVSPDADIKNIAKYHVNHNGWAGIAYHSAVKPNGDILLLNNLENISYHTKGNNTKGISIVLLGDYSKMEITDKQLQSIKILTDAICKTVPIKSIKGHRDAYGAKTKCPGNLAYITLKKEVFY